MDYVKKYLSKPSRRCLLCAAVLAMSLTTGCGESVPQTTTVPEPTAVPQITAVPEPTTIPETTQPVTEAPETEPTQPKELSITVNTPEDFLVLEGMTELESLEIHLTHPTVLPEIGEMTGLQNLTLYGAGYPGSAADLPFLRSCPNLKELLVSNIKLRDSSVLSGLKKLEHLDLEFTLLDDFTPVSQLESLKQLHVLFSNLKDLSPLSKLENLELIYLRSCPVRDVRPLRELKNLTSLQFITTNVTDITPLQSLPVWKTGINLTGQKYDVCPEMAVEESDYLDFLTQEPYIRKKSEESVVADLTYTAALRCDGYVETTSEWGGDTGKWKNIIQIVSKHNLGMSHPDDGKGILGLRRDGTVVEANTGLTWGTLGQLPKETQEFYRTYMQEKMQDHFVPNEELKNWTDIVMLSTCQNIVSGLRSDGTVVSLQLEEGGKTCVNENLHDIVDINPYAALQSDGTVYGTALTNVVDISGYPYCITAWGNVIYEENGKACQIEGWDHIISVKRGNGAGEIYAVREDGKVLTKGLESAKAAAIESWENIVGIYPNACFYGGFATLGVTAAGDLEIYEDSPGYTEEELGTAKLENWWGIRKIFVGPWHTVGLRSDGKLVATGWTYFGNTLETPAGLSGEYLKCDVRDWVAVLLPE